ncbi:hypothetical protein [Motilibacter rhizosphaerae]|uniref:hypothetical protein n=1 Tax=Motilibacter rhizosphaerae TaxID=598652 RepID=UPI00102CC5BD|nr:hypothetical protein [Motilibacter rhizosphaerae]
MPPATAPARGVTEPTLDDLLVSLRRVLAGRFDEVWAAICAAARITPSTRVADPDTLTRVLEATLAQGGAARISGQSLLIRQRSARTLARLGQ